jgi:hypothetical protein
MGQAQRAVAQILVVGLTLGAGSRNMAERIGARIAKICGIFRAAAAHRIENEEERAGHRTFLFRPVIYARLGVNPSRGAFLTVRTLPNVSRAAFLSRLEPEPLQAQRQRPDVQM